MEFDFVKLVFTEYVNFLAYTPTQWQFVLSCLAIAFAIYLAQKNTVLASGYGFFKFLFPKEIYFHRSTKTDLLYLLILPIISIALFVPAVSFLLTLAHQSHEGTSFVLTSIFGPMEAQQTIGETRQIVYLITFTVVFAMAADFGFYLHHVAFHKIPFLWEFHKVHHSAEVLTPLTDFRAHPVEFLTYGVATGACLGIAQGTFTYITASQLSVVSIWGLNAVFFAYNLAGYALRHSHLWISYGPVLSKIFISPAQHQIHHSEAEKHWDRNFGGAFALWDWIFGTLYVPVEKEDLKFGIGPDTVNYRKPTDLYIRPFKQNFSASKRSAFFTVLLVIVILVFAVSVLVSVI